MRLIQHQQEPLMLLAARTVQALRATLAAGFTTVRDMGGLDVGFRQAVDAGLIPGPRVLASLVLLSPTNGMVDATTAQGLPSPPVPGMPTPNCDGPDQARAKVREVLRAGADLIKIATTGGVRSPSIMTAPGQGQRRGYGRRGVGKRTDHPVTEPGLETRYVADEFGEPGFAVLNTIVTPRHRATAKCQQAARSCPPSPPGGCSTTELE